MTVKSLLQLSGPAPVEKPAPRRQLDEFIDVLPLALRALYEHFHGLRDPLAKKTLSADFPIKVGTQRAVPLRQRQEIQALLRRPHRLN